MQRRKAEHRKEAEVAVIYVTVTTECVQCCLPIEGTAAWFCGMGEAWLY